MAKKKPKVTPQRNIIGARVRESRQAFKPPLTQDDVCGRLATFNVHLDRVTIAKIESGLRCAYDFEVRALALVLKVEPSWLLGMDKPPKVVGEKPWD